MSSTCGIIVYNKIYHQIFENNYENGEFIDPKKIAESFLVSAAPVREALLKLSAEGLLSWRPHRGYAVQIPSPFETHLLIRQIQSTYEHWDGVEQPNASLTDWLENQALWISYIESADIRDYLRCVEEVNCRLFSPYLRAFLNNLWLRVWHLRGKVLQNSELLEDLTSSILKVKRGIATKDLAMVRRTCSTVFNSLNLEKHDC